jgi:hypothetical protein
MSYRTFKRVLGETNLERKCRWWFGISLFVLLTLSFTWYSQRTDELVSERIHTLSRELVRAGWQKLHIEKLAGLEGATKKARGDDKDTDLYGELAASSDALGHDFIWSALLPAAEGHDLPTDYLPQDD